VLAHELASIAAHVVDVDAEDDDSSVVLRPGVLERAGLDVARAAPGRPEVQHHGLPAQRRELQPSRLVEPAESEVGGPNDLPAVHFRCHALTVVLHQLPDQQREQAKHERDRKSLRAQLDPCGHAETMKTVVPMRTWTKSHSASEMCIRMHPCEAE